MSIAYRPLVLEYSKSAKETKVGQERPVRQDKRLDLTQD